MSLRTVAGPPARPWAGPTSGMSAFPRSTAGAVALRPTRRARQRRRRAVRRGPAMPAERFPETGPRLRADDGLGEPRSAWVLVQACLRPSGQHGSLERLRVRLRSRLTTPAGVAAKFWHDNGVTFADARVIQSLWEDLAAGKNVDAARLNKPNATPTEEQIAAAATEITEEAKRKAAAASVEIRSTALRTSPAKRGLAAPLCRPMGWWPPASTTSKCRVPTSWSVCPTVAISPARSWE